MIVELKEINFRSSSDQLITAVMVRNHATPYFMHMRKFRENIYIMDEFAATIIFARFLVNYL